MPKELCWTCKQIKTGVELRSSDDRQCPDCFEENERQLRQQKKPQHTMSLATTVSPEPCQTENQAALGAKPRKKQPIRTATQKSSATTAAKGDPANVSDQLPPSGPILQPPIAHAPLQPSSESPLKHITMTSLKSNDEISSLRLLVQQQQQTINSLQSQLAFVLSFLGITETTAPAAARNTDGHETTETKKLFSEVASTKSKSTTSRSFEKAVLTTVSAEARRQQARQNNIIISGVPHSSQTQTGQTDLDYVHDLLSAEFNLPADCVVRCDRLGRPQQNKPQLTRVRLTSDGDANLIINSAKRLRQSANPYVRQHVYVNRDLTKTEAAAAYEHRCQRREKLNTAGSKINNANHPSAASSNQPPSTSSQLHALAQSTTLNSASASLPTPTPPTSLGRHD